MAKRSFVWDPKVGEFTEREPEDRTRYEDIVKARDEIDRRRVEDDLRAGHRGNYL